MARDLLTDEERQRDELRAMSRGAPGAESWIVTALHGLALAVAALAVLLELSLPAGTGAAIVGTVVAVALAGRVARSRLRTGPVWLVALAVGALGLGLGSWLTDGRLPPALLGPSAAMNAGDVVRFGLLAVALAGGLRVTSLRIPAFSAVELTAVALSLAGVVAAHRDGAINHPRVLSDWAWTTGHDPVNVLLLIGAGTVVALAVAMLRERRGRGGRVLLHLAAAGALAALVMLLVTFVGLPKPPRGEGLGQGEKSDGKDGKDKRGGNGGGQGKDDKGQGKGGGGGQGTSGGQGKSNQIEKLEFKNDYSSSSQDAPVAVILLHDDYSPPLGYYYFRQTAFSQYNGHRLVTHTRDDMDKDILADFPTEATAVPDPPKPGPERTTVRSTVALLADHVHPFGLESPVSFAPRESPDPTRFQRSYDVESAALAMKYEELLGKKTFSNSWSPELRAAYTELPDDARYKQLADKIIHDTLRADYQHDPFAQAIAISMWLGKNSTYSRKSQHADQGDPTADFLFGDRIGYCVHFAHAAAYLLRARGLPARIAAGYVADEGRKGSGSTIMLRQKDAHAWAELYLDGFGWIIVDVSPERNLDPPDTPADQDLQRMLGELARGMKPKETQKKKPSFDLPSLATVARSFAMLLSALLLGLYAVKLWRRLAPLFASERTIHRVAYRASLDRLGELGLLRAPGETREAFARRCAERVPSLEPATAANVAWCYGGRRLPTLEEMRQLDQRVAVEAARVVPAWRRLLGLLNPVSFFSTR